MHPYGGIQLCPRCSKAVYAAEQVMGPGRKLYHKPCLACTACNKRLDSYTLLEHDQKPYCKSCHVKNFGTHDLRQANLPHKEVIPSSRNLSIVFPSENNEFTTPSRSISFSRAINGNDYNNDNGNAVNDSDAHDRTVVSSSITPIVNPESDIHGELAQDSNSWNPDSEEERDTISQWLPSSRASPFPASQLLARNSAYTGTLTNTGRPGFGGIPRTVPLSPTRSDRTSPDRSYYRTNNSVSPKGTSIGGTSQVGKDEVSGPETDIIRPLVQTATGTRYGVALGNPVGVHLTGSGGSPRKWGAATVPSCPRCGKSVYFAEQVKAIGKTYHKSCLRCKECNTLLDSSRLRDHDGEPICARCYGKLHGPQGAGYALLGKAGG